MPGKHRLDVTTDSSGDATVYTAVDHGLLVQWRYVPHGSNPLDTGADLDITGEASGFVYANQDNIGTAAFTKAPRQATHDNTGAATNNTDGLMGVSGERVKLVIANGGNTKQGSFHLWIV